MNWIDLLLKLLPLLLEIAQRARDKEPGLQHGIVATTDADRLAGVFEDLAAEIRAKAA